MTTQPLRIGLLGAARITPKALTQPASEIDGVEVTAVAARDRDRATAFAAEHGIQLVLDDYTALCESDQVDAVYNALPAALHHEWTIAALRAGKDVLCEKPLANNAIEAAEMVAVAKETGQKLVEAFHWRYHPLADRIRSIIDTQLGTLRSVDAQFTVPITNTSDIRYQLELGGGGLMDLGCYPVQWVRFAVGAEPTVTSAEAVCNPARVDVDITAQLSFPGGVTGRVHSSMASDLTAWLEVEGDDGRLHVQNPLAPQNGHQVTVTTPRGETTETVEGESTYHHQLVAFRDHVVDDKPILTGGTDAVATMKVIDDIYTAAGIGPRGT